MSKKAPPAPARKNSRAAILDAAEAVANETGANHVTLEAVAGRAGISKGGLLYNFPTKDALLGAMVARFVDRVRDALKGDAPEAGRRPVDALRALVATRLAPRDEAACGPATCSMATALAERPDLLAPVSALYRDIWAEARGAPEARRALLGWLAVEGLMFLELTDTSPLSPAERAQLVEDALASLKG